MSEFKRDRQAETCVTQIPECTPLAPAVEKNPKDVSSSEPIPAVPTMLKLISSKLGLSGLDASTLVKH